MIDYTFNAFIGFLKAFDKCVCLLTAKRVGPAKSAGNLWWKSACTMSQSQYKSSEQSQHCDVNLK